MERTVKKCGRRRFNPFLLFSSENRKKLIVENPGLPIKDISRMLGTLWSQLESHKRQEFCTKAKELKEKYLKESSGYQFNPWTARRLREKQNISLRLIVWRPTTVQPIQMSLSGDGSQQTNKQSIRPQVEPISEKKRSFFSYLGLCQKDSTEHFDIKDRLALNARKYHIFTATQTFPNKGNDKTQTAIKDNKVKRPRGRPRKYWPKPVVYTNQVNKV